MNVRNASILLMIATIFWGSTFPFSKYLTDYFHTFTLVTYRFLIAALILFIIFRKDIIRSTLTLWKNKAKVTVGFIALLGIFNFLAIICQTEGLRDVSATNSGFITSLAILFVPIIEFIFRRKRQSFKMLLAIFMALIGVYIMSFGLSMPKVLMIGDLYTMLSSIIYSFFIVCVDELASRNIKSSVMMFYAFLLTAILTLMISLFAGIELVPSSEMVNKVLLFLGYLAIGATVFPYLFMGIGQKYVTPTQAALIYIFEPIFAVIIAMIVIHERPGINALIGAMIIIIAQLISIIEFKSEEKNRATEVAL